MIYKCLFILTFVSLFLVAPNDEVIPWRENLKLTWDQFKGAPKPNITAVAVTASGITFQFSVKETDGRIVSFETEVVAHFYPNKSWYIKERSDARILAHEQLHFDITEMFVRKFRKQISHLKVSNNIKTQLRDLHQKINKELADTQNRYDKETDNSIIQETQDQWEIFVRQELAKLDTFKSTE